MSKIESRREFLKEAGKMAGAAALFSAAAPILSACQVAAAEEKPSAPEYPFPYVKLDVEAVRKRGYESYFKMGGCCIGVADAVIGTLADEVGYPFNQIPIGMFADGKTGYGGGSLCGSLGGAAGAIGLVCGPKDAEKVLAELFDWYRNTPLPIYQPEAELKQTVAHSINCADSVGTYMAASNITEMSDPNRKKRCGGVTADVAAKVAELLNIHFGYAEAPAEVPAEEALKANEYIGVGKGFRGDVKVKVTMDGDKIAAIDVLESAEDLGAPAIAKIPAEVIAKQSTEGVDAVGGATYTSKALFEAINNALAQVKK